MRSVITEVNCFVEGYGNLGRAVSFKAPELKQKSINGTTGVCYDKTKDSYIVTVGKKYIGRCKDIDDAIKLRQSSLDNDYTLRHGGKN